MKAATAALLSMTWIVTSAGAATSTVDCDAGEKIQAKLDQVKPGDVIEVRGTCNEGVQVPSEMVRITFTGPANATIRPPQDKDGFFIRGRDITVRGFMIIGGRDGIHLSGQAAGASAVIEGNTIRQTRRWGIHLDQTSVARIGGNVIEDTPSFAIDISEGSSARIGFLIFDPLPNTIRNAGGHAIVVRHGSSAYILGNVIENNKGSGIVIDRNSHADVWANSISANGADALSVTRGSGVVVTGVTMPRRENGNETDPGRLNEGYGVTCTLGGYVDGPIAKLAGKRGAKRFDNSCIEAASP
ncbi:right-handed parallel beta-helix repeat-containing protein [Bradyrhizobium erythrophlei]|uniref:right-handed parallel beta-helix repeat-containing protein n=1 Tax=Bradyrhizobium erythrophlei TaxID=1437360 RepID=UPI0035EA26F3